MKGKRHSVEAIMRVVRESESELLRKGTKLGCPQSAPVPAHVPAKKLRHPAQVE
jgi:hypothetical protein